MAEIAPFRGILYQASGGDATPLLAPPYDVISEEERAALLGLSPFNCVRLILPSDEKGGQGEGKYAAAARTLSEWLRAGVMARDETPALYRYHQVFSPKGEDRSVTRRGFICRIRLHRFAERIVLPHERTLAGPKADRLKLKRATRTHLSQVFGLFDDKMRQVDEAFREIEAQDPALFGRTQDGVLHRLWRLTDARRIAQVAALLRDKRVYIADGHHRYETMLTLRDELRREPGYRGVDSAIEYGTIFLCNASDPGLLIFPTHRVVHGLPRFDLAALLQGAARCFKIEERRAGDAREVRETLAEMGRAGPSFLVASGGRHVYLRLRQEADFSGVKGLRGPSVLRELDVTLLHALILEELLGIDQAAQEAQTHLRYIKDTEQALAAAHAEGVQAVFLMNPTPVVQVMAVADAGEVMPQKSTYFYPKIASGIVLNPLDPSEPVDRVAGPE